MLMMMRQELNDIQVAKWVASIGNLWSDRNVRVMKIKRINYFFRTSV